MLKMCTYQRDYIEEDIDESGGHEGRSDDHPG